jgi:hypothetical protein
MLTFNLLSRRKVMLVKTRSNEWKNEHNHAYFAQIDISYDRKREKYRSIFVQTGFFLILNKERIWEHVVMTIYGWIWASKILRIWYHLSLNRMKIIFGFLSSSLAVIPPLRNFYPIERVKHRIFFIPSVSLYIDLIFNPW